MAKRKQKSNRNVVTESRRPVSESRFNGNYSFAVYFARRDPRLFEAWYDNNAHQLFLTESSRPTMLQGGGSPPTPQQPQGGGRMRRWLIGALVAAAMGLGIGGTMLVQYVNNKLAQQGQPPASQQELRDLPKQVTPQDAAKWGTHTKGVDLAPEVKPGPDRGYDNPNPERGQDLPKAVSPAEMMKRLNK